MMNRKLKLNKMVMLFSIFFIFILCLGAVNAIDNDDNCKDEVLTKSNEDIRMDNKVLVAEVTSNNLGNVDASKNNLTIIKNDDVQTSDKDVCSENSILQTINTKSIFKEKESGSYGDLNVLIKSSTGKLVLNNNYKFNTSLDSQYKDGIDISKDLIIDGNGFSIDGSNIARAFKINSKVILKNINIINTQTSTYGAIEVRAENCQLININFNNNKATVAGNLYSAGVSILSNNVSIINSTFRHVNMPRGTWYDASCILIAACNVNVINSTFNHVTGGTSAIFVSTGCDDALIKNCQFNDCTNITRRNAAVAGYASYTIIDSCYFTNCVSVMDDTGTGGVFKNITAIGCTDWTFKISQGAVYTKVYDSTFINCVAIAQLISSSSIDNCTIFGAISNPPIILSGVGAELYNTKFINCSSQDLVSVTGDYAKIENCSFINATTNNGCIVYMPSGIKYTVKNCIVINCHKSWLFYNNNRPNVKANMNMGTHIIIDSVTSCSNFDSFVPIMELWVSEDGTGEGLNENDATNWTYATQTIDAGGVIHLKSGIYNSIPTTSIIYSVVGEGKVVINKAKFTFNVAFIEVRNIIFNNTDSNTILYGQCNLTNCTFTNFQHSTTNIIDIFYKKNSIIQDIVFINCNFNGINSGSNAIEYLNAFNLHFYDCTINDYLFKTREGGSFNIANITFNNSKIYGIVNRNGYNSMLRFFYFDGLTITNSNITGKFWESQYNINTAYNIFSNFYIKNCTYIGSNPFMTIQLGNTLSNMTIIDLKCGGNQIIFDFINGPIVNHITLDSIVAGTIFNVQKVCSLKDVDANKINAVKCFVIPDSMILDNITFNNANFTDKIGVLGNNNDIINSNFINFIGNIQILGSNVKISNCNFAHGRTAGDGGAINLISGNDIFIDSCSFINNTAINGGAVYINNVTNASYILNSIFSKNTVSHLGGAIFVEPGIYYYISQSSRKTLNTTFRFNDLFDNDTLVYMEDVWVQNGVYGNGTYENPTNLEDAFTKVSPYGNIHFRINGDIFDYSSSIIEKVVPKMNLTFVGNDTIIKGFTFIFNVYATGVSMYNIMFTEYDADNVIKWMGDDGLIVNCTFQDNGGYNVGNGSALYVLGDNLRIINSSFINNLAGADDSVGGAIYCNGTGLVIDCCNFKDNRVYDAGAHIYLSEDAMDLRIFNSNFTNGTAININRKGVGVYILGSEFIVSGSNFTDNCARYGGALYLSGAGNIKDSCFHNNSATNGSAIYIVKAGVNMVDNGFASPKFNENNNIIKGYVYALSDVVLKNNTLSFTDLNKTVSEAESNLDLEFNYKYYENYDALFVSGVTIDKILKINGNSFHLDGANSVRIFNIFDANVELSNLTFTNGNASLGGAIYVIGNITITDSNFTNNRAVLGGAIFIERGYSNLTNCIFINNSAGNGSAIYVMTSVNHWDYLDFINNIALNNATVYFKEDSTVYSNNLTFTGNVVPNGLHIVGENHIYSSVLYVNMTHLGFGIIPIEPASLDWALDNILEEGKIILLSDYVLESMIEFSNLHNITVIGNTYNIRKDKCLFILLT